MAAPTLRRVAPVLLPLYEFIFPPVCFACGRSLPHAPSRVCDDCWKSIRPLNPDHPLLQETLEHLHRGGRVDSLVAPFLFEKDGTLQRLLHQVKYDGMERLAGLLGRAAGESLRASGVAVGAAGLVPVPLHRSKLRERGYNQSEAIARGIGLVTGAPVLPRLLERRKRTASQTHLSLEERRENVRNAFRLSHPAPPPGQGGTLVLVDDVVTTGSTLEACAAVLKDAGVKGIVACTVAVAPRLFP